MRQYEFVTVDVFTDTRFGGNPLAVLPDADGLTGAEMQALAAEFNLSETAFVLPPADPAHTARVRIFTPRTELPFAGHPNVGTGWVLARRMAGAPERLVFEEAAGLVGVDLLRGEDGTLHGARIGAPIPLRVGPDVPAALAAACGGLTEADVRSDRHAPVVAGVGVDFTFVELRDRAALRRACPDLAAAEAFRTQFPDLAHGLAVHLYVRGERPGAAVTRMFAPLSGIPEDPATGSANAALAALLLRVDGGDEAAWTIEQGVDMGRPSLLHATARRGPDGIRATVGGNCVPVMRGTVEL